MGGVLFGTRESNHLNKHIIDSVTGLNTGGIITALVFFVLMRLLQIVVRAVSSRINAKVSIRVNQQIVAQIYDKLLITDWEALSAYHSGDLLSRVVGDANTVSASVLGLFPELLTRFLQFAGTLGGFFTTMLPWQSWRCSAPRSRCFRAGK